MYLGPKFGGFPTLLGGGIQNHVGADGTKGKSGLDDLFLFPTFQAWLGQDGGDGRDGWDIVSVGMEIEAVAHFPILGLR